MDSGYDLVRIGGEAVGDYLVPLDFNGLDACCSIGCDLLWDFKKDLAGRYEMPLYILDWLIMGYADLMPMQSFQDWWLGSITGDFRVALSDWINQTDLCKKF